ncbi:hypothetical protein [Limibacillus halophilus]|uniref:CBS domain-containing protein n=1 Tax=Limibacillus halophilus TaxID=1579333 RepID=A0A839SWE8_9PROT|nr:hypothetical protein [Limibacillus halophilus]MBB3066004.1 hypothetical protein [Limibacillus halophilus]
MNQPWANSEPLSSSETFEEVHQGLTVRLVMTRRDNFEMCDADDPVSTVAAKNTNRYDFIPVMSASAKGERIIGLFYAAPYFKTPPPKGCIKDHLVPLDEENLIGADASILAFILEADTKPCRLVLSGGGICGLVTLSDLQKLPVRAALFALITGFEITMAEAIRNRHPTDETWMELLSEERLTETRKKIDASKKSESFVDALLFTEFADKKTIIKKSIALSISKNQLEVRLTEIQKFRDMVAHANEYAPSPEEAKMVCATVRDLIDLRKLIAETPG